MVIGVVCLPLKQPFSIKSLINNLSHDMIELLHDSDIYVYKGMVSVDPGQRWRAKVASAKEPKKGNSRIWLLGDAIHAMLPNR